MEKKDLSELVTQLEYYLSDSNLQYDEFFNSAIEKGTDMYLEVDLVMNCNKIKKAGWTIVNVQSAVEQSDALELHEDQTMFRRKDKVLPEFLGEKRQEFKPKTRSKSKTEEEMKVDATTEAEDKEKYFVPCLLVIPDISSLPKNGKLIEETIGKQYDTKVPYARVNKQNGHIVFDRNATEQDLLNKILKEGFEFEGNKIDVIQASDRELNFFNKENLSYLDKIVKKKFGKQVKKAGKVAEKKLQNVVMFAGKRYNNFSGLQTEFKNIISKTRNGAELETAQNELLKEVLKFHSHGEEKLKNVKGFTVDFHPTYKQTRCFFIVKEDDTREDFSLHKCLNVLKEQLINEE